MSEMEGVKAPGLNQWAVIFLEREGEAWLHDSCDCLIVVL